MDIFSLHMNTTYTLHVYHILYMYYDLQSYSTRQKNVSKIVPFRSVKQ